MHLVRLAPVLSIDVASGSQVAITDAPVKRGMLLLRPEHVVVLGGEVSLQRSLPWLWQCSVGSIFPDVMPQMYLRRSRGLRRHAGKQWSAGTSQRVRQL